MPPGVHLTHTSAMILQAVASGYRYGFEIMAASGLPSGTVYPALRRLERAKLLRSRWEDEARAHREQRPARKYYEIGPRGRRALEQAVRRYRHLPTLLPLAPGRARLSRS